MAWDVSWTWRGLTETHSHLPVPEQVFLSMLALALHWNWPDVACMIVPGFLAMLRPAEFLKVTPADRSFLGDANTGRQTFVFMGNPKMRRFGPCREHVRLDDQELIPFFQWVKNHFLPNQQFCPGTARDFRRCFDAICRALHTPCVDGHGLTPASLRAGGATFWYRRMDSTEFVRFRGRWANSRMLEIYIQEVAALSIETLLLQGIGILYVRMLASPRLPCSPLAVLSLPAGRLSLLSLLSLFVSRGFSGEGSYMWSGFSCCVAGLWFSAIWRGIIFWVPSTLLLAACMTKPIKHARCPCRPM
jgi:hypothetical protein